MSKYQFQMSSEACLQAAKLFSQRAELQDKLEELDAKLAVVQSSGDNGKVAHPKRGRPVGAKSNEEMQAPKIKPPKSKGEISTFKETGKGRKQCPKCEVYVAARSGQCVCGYDFSKGKTAAQSAPKEKKAKVQKPNSEIATFKETGKGRKQCPKCEVYVAARSGQCACGHTFKSKTAPNSKENISTDEDAGKHAETQLEVLSRVIKEGGTMKHGDVVAAFLKSYKTKAKPKTVSAMVSTGLGKLLNQNVIVKDEERNYSPSKKAAKKPSAKKSDKKPAGKKKAKA